MPNITNEATATYQFNGSTQTETTTSNVNTVFLQTNNGLELTKSGSPSTFLAGDIIDYTVTITNTSGSFYTGVRIIDDLGGNNLAYVLGSATLTVGTLTYPVTPVATNPLTFTLQQLNVGQTMTLRYRAQVIFNLPSTTNTITNRVRGIGYTSTGTIEGATSFTIQKKTSDALSLDKSASVTETSPNETISYYLRLTNFNSVDAIALSVSDQLPQNFVVTSIGLQIGTGSVINLDATDYTLTDGNFLTLPSLSGPIISVPSGETTTIIITGYFN